MSQLSTIFLIFTFTHLADSNLSYIEERLKGDLQSGAEVETRAEGEEKYRKAQYGRCTIHISVQCNASIKQTNEFKARKNSYIKKKKCAINQSEIKTKFSYEPNGAPSRGNLAKPPIQVLMFFANICFRNLPHVHTHTHTRACKLDFMVFLLVCPRVLCDLWPLQVLQAQAGCSVKKRK